MQSKKTLRKMNDLANAAFILFSDGWTKSQLLGTMSRRGVKPGNDSMLAINTAWNHYQDIGKEYAAH